ncbi:MAG: NADH-quinone oxidoreductase subunit NuoN [Rhodovibrionaceae bacterium]
MSLTTDLFIALPELFLVCSAIGLLMFGVFGASTRVVCLAGVAAAAITLVLIWLAPESGAAFSGLFMKDPFGDFMKSLVMIGTGTAIVLSIRYIEHEGMARFEFPVLMLFATVGMLMMISANDLMSLYLGLEIQSLSLYVIAAFRRDALRSSEAGLKYFVLGALSSGMLLYGISLVYGFAGGTGFDDLAAVFAGGEEVSIGVIVGLVFIISGLAFKISAVPFHMWTPDVYEGSPTPVTAFFASAPKIAAMALTVRVMMGPFAELLDQWQQIIVFVSIASMILGSLAAIAQQNIKRLMAYSSIGHVGYALIGLAAGSAEGIRGVGIYMAIYLVMNLGTFAVILCMKQKDRMVEQIGDLAGLSKTNPMLALALAIFMFSMAGIPPLAGFFGKLYVFMAAVETGLYTLAVVGVLTSVISAFYYLRIIKVMYFDEPEEGFDRPGRELSIVLGVCAAMVLLFFVLPSPLVDGAAAAASAFFPG